MNEEQDIEQLDDTAADAPAPATSADVSRQKGRQVDYQGAGKRLMERCITDAKNNTPRLDRDRADWQNLLFHRGGRDNHWSVWDRTTQSYVPRGTDPEKGGLPEWVPRACTNVFATKIDGIVAILDQSDPSKLFYPATDDDADRAAAEVAEDADPVLLEEIGYDTHRPQLNKLATLTNGAALIVWFDNDPKYGQQDIPLLACPTCGVQVTPMVLEDEGNVCPGPEGAEEPCGTDGDTFEPVIDPLGVPQGVPYNKGKLCSAVIPSFEYSIPSSARIANSNMVPWVLTHSSMAKEDVLARWKKAKAVLDRASNNKVGGSQRAFARAMKQLSSPIRAQQGATLTSSGMNEPTVYILQHDPIDEDDFYFPDGFHGVMVEDELVEFGPLPVKDDDDRARKSILLRSFANSPGSPYAKPPADDLVPLQISRNLVESLIQLILMHDAAPRNWIPLSVTLENQPTGRPGESIFYRSTIPGEKPQTDRGVNPPEGLYKYLEMIDAKFEELSKLNSVLAGARPEGDPTLGEVQRLEENGMRAFKEPLEQLMTFERDLSRLLLWLAKDTAWADRARRIRGENGQWEIREFNAADIGGKVDLLIEKASAWPKSVLARRMALKEAFEMGALPPPAQDPELQLKVLTELGLTEMKPSMDADRKQIARELDRWKAATMPQEIAPPNPDTQELPFHLFFKKQFLKTEEFEQLTAANPATAQAMVQHVQMIQQILAQQAAAAAAAQNPPPPDNRTPAEKGDGSAVEEAVASGALMPADAAPQADPMQDALNAGVLMPAAAVPGPTGPSIDQLMEAGAIAPAPQDSATAPPG